MKQKNKNKELAMGSLSLSVMPILDPQSPQSTFNAHLGRHYIQLNKSDITRIKLRWAAVIIWADIFEYC